MLLALCLVFFFFFNDTATTEIYTLSLHDALPIWVSRASSCRCPPPPPITRRATRPLSRPPAPPSSSPDRKSTRLNSSHLVISYAVFCLKKKKKKHNHTACARGHTNTHYTKRYSLC